METCWLSTFATPHAGHPDRDARERRPVWWLLPLATQAPASPPICSASAARQLDASKGSNGCCRFARLNVPWPCLIASTDHGAARKPFSDG